MKVGFIGLGHMGGPMCRNIIKGGHEVLVHDLSEAAVQACVYVGGIAGGSIANVADQVDVVMTSLPMPKDVEAVALGPDGIADNANAGTIYIDLSTNSPAMMKKIAGELADRGIVTLDGPVSGGVVGAEKATIAIMVGGDKAAFDSCMPVFESFGKTIVHTGELGSGCVAKLVNNMIAFTNMMAGAEGLMLGVAAGMDPAVLNEIVRNSSGNSMGYRGVAKSALERDFAPAFTVDLAYKDLRLALELADELDMPLMLGPQVHNVMRMARSKDQGGENVTAILKVYEAAMGQQVGPAK
ncbi:MAG: NAD(P)-dependent oxidoreductase [Rhodospirillaceae bacterium]|jgi:3-hydroxyisobutyrate dehydrogenase-like beta-hydroxyacid dehydrogenase|nr:NAD(P)-dependent oxidoreductase [Rhodospirillaceae bacterium]MBT5190849.1 NAD(P)-dependent oxidoreductase [Rhodospirillaceae bacterium]MBT5898265.1 NAD(P)-dependent oxidoreductase [Rhodospirillaceae bacterium]MBT7759985.1 NAD(P)-dependent oxidoreductase [Rhodospirillaceae bacterium]